MTNNKITIESTAFGESVKLLRIQKDWRLIDLGKALRTGASITTTSINYLSRIEQGQDIPNKAFIKRLAKAFGVKYSLLASLAVGEKVKRFKIKTKKLYEVK